MATSLRVLRFPGAEHIGREDAGTKKSREILPYSNNETASYIPNNFLDTGAFSLPKTLCSHSVESLSADFLKKYNQTKSSAKLLNTAIKISEHIKNHVESRLQLFLYLLLIVFKTECTFEKFTTQSQAGVKIKKEKQKKDPSELVEAHAATLPNLQYVSNQALSADDLKITDLKPRVLAPHTSYYNDCNMTHKLPRFVNDVDSLIDKNISIPFFDDFRHFCLKIVNDMARSKNSGLRKGFLNFLTNFEIVIDKAITQWGELYQKIVLGCYKEVVHSYVIGVSQSIFWKTMNYMVRSNIEDPEADLIPVRLQNRISIELSCLDKIAKIKAFCGNSQERDWITRKVIIDLASIDSKAAVIWNQAISMNIEFSTTISKHVDSCYKDETLKASIQTFLQGFQNDEAFLKALKDLKNAPIFREIKNFLGSRVNNLEYICLNVIKKVNSEKQSILTTKFFKFFQISPSNLQKISSGKIEFDKTVEALVKRADVQQIHDELYEEIIKLE